MAVLDLYPGRLDPLPHRLQRRSRVQVKVGVAVADADFALVAVERV